MAVFDVSKLNLSLMKYRKFAMFLSIAAIIVSLVSLSVKGINYSVDFSGGIALQLAFENPPEDIGDIRGVLADTGHSQATIQAYDDGSFLIRYQDTDESTQQVILNALRDKFGKVAVQKIDNVGPVVGQELRKQAAVAIGLSILAILAYMAVRFRFRFGVAAVAALLHDSIIMLGAYSLTGREISTSFIAAILTVIGYSLNDTIVVMDRVRENWSKLHRDGIVNLVNNSVNQTMSRTINTSLTTLMPVLAMFFLGGEVVSNLAFAFLVGIVVGTYSSIYIASSIVVEWYLRRPVRG
jgi:preprotein translocase subunit SecF